MKKRVCLLIVSIVLMAALCAALGGCNSLSSLMKRMDGTKDVEANTDIVKLSIPNLSIDDGTIKWQNVSGAEKYFIQCSKDQQVVKSLYSNSPSLPIAGLGLAPGKYTFVVRSESKIYGKSEFSDAIEYTVQADVNLDSVEIGIYRVDADKVLCTWTALEGAAVYHLRYGDTVTDTTANFIVLEADSSADVAVVFSVTGVEGYEAYNVLSKSAAMAAADMQEVSVVAFDLKDGALSLDGFDNATDVCWDGIVLNLLVDGRLTFSDNFIGSQSTGYHYLKANVGGEEHRVLLAVVDTRPLQFVNGAGIAIDEMDYVKSSAGMTVYMRVYDNHIVSVSINEGVLADTDYTLAEDRLIVAGTYVSTMSEGTYILKVAYTTSDAQSKVAGLTIAVTEPALVHYDIASHSDLTLTGLTSRVTIIGGGITSADYASASDSLLIRNTYLSRLSAGYYEYWLGSVNNVANGSMLTIEVHDSAATPTVRLSYDDHDTYVYGKYQCNCGGSSHSYSLDGAAFAAATDNVVFLGEVDKHLQHSFAVRCNTSGQTATHTITPSGDAYDYMTQR